MFTSIFGRVAAPYLARRRAAFRLRFASVLRTSLWLPFASLTLLCLPLCCTAQYKYDYNWIVGYSNSPTTANGNLLNFNISPVVAVNVPDYQFETQSCNLTMSDASGNLIFYSDGCQIANANFEVMLGGDSINPGEVHDEYCSGYNDLEQSMLALPSMVSPDKYLVFHVKNVFTPSTIVNRFLLKTTIDMSQEGEIGRAHV